MLIFSYIYCLFGFPEHSFLISNLIFFIDGCQCGKIVGSNYQISPAAAVFGRVVGGHEPEIHSIPWQVGIMGT